MGSGIYEIVNTINGKRYVGSAANFVARWKLHLLHLRRGTHHSKHLQSSWARHAEMAFVFRRILICDRANLILYEQIAIDALAPEFNVCRVAGSCLGLKHTPETKAKLSVAKLGNTATLGYKHRAESIEKLRAKQLGVTSPTKGLRRDPAAVAATAAAHRGMKRSPETCAKIAAKAIGRKRSAESVEKGASKRRGMPLSAEHRATLIGNKHAAGVKQTEERKRAIAETSRAMWSDPIRRAALLAARQAARERRKAA